MIGEEIFEDFSKLINKVNKSIREINGSDSRKTLLTTVSQLLKYMTTGMLNTGLQFNGMLTDRVESLDRSPNEIKEGYNDLILILPDSPDSNFIIFKKQSFIDKVYKHCFEKNIESDEYRVVKKCLK